MTPLRVVCTVIAIAFVGAIYLMLMEVSKSRLSLIFFGAMVLADLLAEELLGLAEEEHSEGSAS